MVDLLIAGLVWARPLASTGRRAAAWGVFGGLCALASPVVGFAWAVLALLAGARSGGRGGRGRLALAALLAMLTISPWVVRNYLVFGRLIPVKSNLAFELYQSQCLRPDGLLHGGVFGSHPFVSNNKERRHYARLGEMAYLDEKMMLFRKSVAADPAGLARRIGNRFLAATVLYTPYDRTEERRRPWFYRVNRWLYPLAFACLVFTMFVSPRHSVAGDRALWIVSAVYLAYLLPYAAISFYDRYKLPLLGVDATLIACGLASLKRCLPWPAVADEPVEVIVEVDDAPVVPRAERPGLRPRARIKQHPDGVES
jgi:hypothetical protein